MPFCITADFKKFHHKFGALKTKLRHVGMVNCTNTTGWFTCTFGLQIPMHIGDPCNFVGSHCFEARAPLCTKEWLRLSLSRLPPHEFGRLFESLKTMVSISETIWTQAETSNIRITDVKTTIVIVKRNLTKKSAQSQIQNVVVPSVWCALFKFKCQIQCGRMHHWHPFSPKQCSHIGGFVRYWAKGATGEVEFSVIGVVFILLGHETPHDHAFVHALQFVTTDCRAEGYATQCHMQTVQCNHVCTAM